MIEDTQQMFSSWEIQLSIKPDNVTKTTATARL